MALRLWGRSSLCIVWANVHVVERLTAQVVEPSTSTADGVELIMQAAHLLTECRRVVTSRRQDALLFPGSCYEPEVAFYAHLKLANLEEVQRPLQLSDTEKRNEARTFGPLVGYGALVIGASHTLAVFSQFTSIPADVKTEANDFVLGAWDAVADATHGVSLGEEAGFVEDTEMAIQHRRFEKSFKNLLQRRFDSPGVQRALRARRVLGLGVELYDAVREQFGADAAADKAKHGLCWCALPACAKQEASVFEFKACSACKAVAYCSSEHAALHWAQGHKKECKSLKAAGAKPRSTADDGGADAAPA